MTDEDRIELLERAVSLLIYEVRGMYHEQLNDADAANTESGAVKFALSVSTRTEEQRVMDYLRGPR